MIEGIGLALVVWGIIWAVFGLLGFLDWWRYGRARKLYPRTCAWCEAEGHYFIVDYCEVEGSTAICPHHLEELRRKWRASCEPERAKAAAGE